MKKFFYLSVSLTVWLASCAKEVKKINVIPETNTSMVTKVSTSAGEDTFKKKFDASEQNYCDSGSGSCLSTVVIYPTNLVMDDFFTLMATSPDALPVFVNKNQDTLDDYLSLDVIGGIIDGTLIARDTKKGSTHYVQITQGESLIAVYPIVM